jgi:hypothetical protein
MVSFSLIKPMRMERTVVDEREGVVIGELIVKKSNKLLDVKMEEASSIPCKTMALMFRCLP